MNSDNHNRINTMPTVQIEGFPKPISKIGLGTWQFGSYEWGYGNQYADQEAKALVRRAIELGITLFDTAEVYGWGNSEKILGESIGGFHDRVVIATKFFPAVPTARLVQRHGRASAHRLGVRTLDLYQVHWHNPMLPVSHMMRGMRELQDAQVIQAVGVSSFSLPQWQEAEQALGRTIISNQVEYSLLNRKPEQELIPWAEANGHLIIAYSPLAQGVLTGKYSPDKRPGGFRAEANPLFLPENLQRVQPILKLLREVADAHQVTSAQIALAWAIRSPAVVAIPGASSIRQLESNAAAAHLQLREDEVKALETATAAFEPVPIQGLAPARAALTGLLVGVGQMMRQALRLA